MKKTYSKQFITHPGTILTNIRGATHADIGLKYLLKKNEEEIYTFALRRVKYIVQK